MIFDTISNRDCYSELPEIHRALVFLASLTPDTLPQGWVNIAGEQIRCAVQNPVTKPIEACRFEAHRRYIDIHYTVSGVEGIALRNTEDLVIEEKYRKDADVSFHTGEHHSITFIHPGEFLVCFPQDAHKVGIMSLEPEQVTKIIVKIEV